MTHLDTAATRPEPDAPAPEPRPRTRRDPSARWTALPAFGPEHWTRDADPTLEADAACVFAPYEDRTSADSPEQAATMLCTLLERITGTGTDAPRPKWEDAIAELDGLYHIVKHSPHFREEAEALRLLVHGESVLSQFMHKVNRL